jgi:hypothetical protein
MAAADVSGGGNIGTTQEESGFNFGDFLSGLFGTGLNVESIRQMQEALGRYGQQAYTGLTDIGREAQAGTEFRPFTVTTGVGQATTTGGQPIIDPNTGQPVIDPKTGQPMLTGFGDLSVGLTPEQRALQQTLFGGSQALAGQATAAYDPIYAQIAQQAYGGVSPLLTQAQTAAEAAGAMDRAAREQQVYGQLRALQSPEEERQRLALESRLAAQGRLGTQTAQFGGTPEGLALAKAQAEAQNQAALMAMQQAGTEQQQAIARAQGLQGLAGGMFGMGTTARMTPQQLQASQLQNLAGMMTAGYAPEREVLQALQPGISIADIAAAGQRQGAGLFAESAASGLEAQLNAALRAADLESGLFQALASGIGGSSSGGLFSQLLNKLFPTT